MGMARQNGIKVRLDETCHGCGADRSVSMRIVPGELSCDILWEDGMPLLSVGRVYLLGCLNLVHSQDNSSNNQRRPVFRELDICV